MIRPSAWQREPERTNVRSVVPKGWLLDSTPCSGVAVHFREMNRETRERMFPVPAIFGSVLSVVCG